MSVAPVPGVRDPGVPEPPPGPGVQPPFVAPPTDGSRRRRWIATSLVGAAVLVVCIGGSLGLGALVVFGTQMIVDGSRTAVTDHLTAVRDGDYTAAYEQLCDRLRDELSEEEFRDSVADEATIEDFEVGDPQISDRIVVPTTLIYGDGRSEEVRYLLEQDTSTGGFEVCGRED